MNPDPTLKKSIVLPIVLTTLVSAIVFGGVGYYLGMGGNTTATPTVVTYTPKPKATASAVATTAATTSPTATAAATTDDTSSWKTYSNTKYNYSFKYPDTVNINSIVGIGTEAAITPTADSVSIAASKGEYFSVSNAALSTFTDESVKASINGDHPELLTTSSAQISGKKAIKVSFKDAKATDSTFYFVELAPKSIIEITVTATDLGPKLFNTFKFTK